MVMKKIGAIILAIIIILLSTYIFMATERQKEIKKYIAMLRGAEIVADNNIISQPPIIGSFLAREWVFEIDDEEREYIRMLCSENMIAANYNANNPEWCFASSYMHEDTYGLAFRLSPSGAMIIRTNFIL